MPNCVSLSTGQLSTSRLDGDTLRVHPEVFSAMQEALALGDPAHADMNAAEALRRAGLTESEIVGRTFQNTKIVVDPSLTSRMIFSEPQ